MKNRLSPIVALVLIIAASQSFAQSERIATTISTEKHDPSFALGRDFWFAPAQNYLDEPGKYIRIYITSANNTNAFVECEGLTKAVPISAFGVGSFNVPLDWEMKSSGVIESKAIHVWDVTDDITVFLMSHDPYTSDGTYCIPTIGWGTDYVVAAYESLYETNGSYVYDFPSEFTIVADQDNTIVEITPSCDLRNASMFNEDSDVVAYHRGQKFEDTLMRGQCIQYQAVLAKDVFNYDATGTIIHSNNTVGIVGASMCPNIPYNSPYCDFVMDMIPPVRTWGETYFTTCPYQPPSVSATHDLSMYLMISSKNNQTIHRYNATTGDQVVCTIDSQYHRFWTEDPNANKWYSDAPFLLVQYINSSSFPNDTNGNGDPAEVVIPAKENFSKTAFVTCPFGTGAQAPYDNYANVIVNVKDQNNVTFDGKKITSYIVQPIDSVYEIYVIPHISGAAHVVKSDSGTGIYVYGYGYDETFAWGGSSGVSTVNSPDIAPPVAQISSQCFAANVHLADTGTFASKLSEISIDTDINMAYLPDPYPFWIDGAGFDTSGYSMYVVDNTKPATLTVSVFDFAGNRTTIRSTYSPSVADLEPALQSFGSISTAGPAFVLYDTLINSGTLPIKLSNLSLQFGNVGFTIDSIGGSDFVQPGQRRLIPISFLPIKKTAVVDTIIYDDGCFRSSASLIGSGGGDDFYVSDAQWVIVPFPAYPPGNWVAKAAVIHNLSRQDSIYVDTAGWTDRVHFLLLPKQNFPVHLSPIGTKGDTASVWFYFEPSNMGRDTAIASWTSPQVKNSDSSLSIRFDKLTAYGAAPHLTFASDTTVSLDCPSPGDSIVHLYFVLANTGAEFAVINKVTVSDPTDFVNLTGRDQHGNSWNPTKQAENIDANATDTFTVDFHYKPDSNVSATTNITAFGISGDTLGGGTLTANVNVNYWAGAVSTPTINFGIVPWMGVKDTQSFTITNTATSNLYINDIFFSPGGKHDSSYSISTAPPLPGALTPGQIMTVDVTFNPSVSGDPVQNDTLQFDANWCNGTTLPLYAMLSGSGVAEEIAPPTTATIIQLDDGKSIHVIIPSAWPPPVRLDIYNILGESVYSSSFDATATFDLGELPRGVYFYRLREGDISQTGKILLGQ